jgi:hypothetical protein
MFFWYSLANVTCEGRRIEHVFLSCGYFQLRAVELALNVAWALIAAASYALLFRRLVKRDKEYAQSPMRWQCVIGLTCILAILFPVISLTDDLHEIQATAEDASLSALQMKRCVAGHSSTPQRTPHRVFFTFASFEANARLAILEDVAARWIVRPAPGSHPPALGRAPPSIGSVQIS